MRLHENAVTRGSDPLGFLTAALVAAAIRRPAVTVMCVVALAVVSAWFATNNLHVNSDSSRMLSADLPFQQRTDAFNKAFPLTKNSIIIVVRSAIPDAADAVAGELTTALQSADAIESAFSAASDPFFKTNGLLYQTVDELDAQLYKLNSAASTIAYLRDNPNLPSFFKAMYSAGELAAKAEFDTTLLDELYGKVAANIALFNEGSPQPFSWQAAFDAKAEDEADARIVMVSPKLNFDALQPAAAARAEILQAIIDVPHELRNTVEIEVTGDPILRFEELRSVRDGLVLSFLVSVGLSGLLLVICYRSFARTLLTIATLFVTLSLSAGFAALTVGTLNLVSVAFVVLLVGLGLDFTIHALLHVSEYAGRMPVREAVVASARSNGLALALSAVTTAAAFLAFAPTAFVGMAQLGIIGSAGVILAFLVAITLVPALVVLRPRVATVELWHGRPNATQRPARLSLRSRPVHLGLAALFLAVSVAAGFVAPQVRFEADPIKLRDPQSPSMVALARLNADPDTSAYRISIMRDSEASTKALADRLETVPGVHEVRTLADFIPEDQDTKLQTIDLAYPTLESLVYGEGLDLSELEEGETALDALRKQLAETPIGDGSRALEESLSAYGKARTTATDKALEQQIFRFFPDLFDRFEAQLSVDEVGYNDLPPDLSARFRSQDGLWRVEVVPTENLTNPVALDEFVDAVSAVDPNIAGAPAQIEGAGTVVSKAMLEATLIAAFLVALVSFAAVRRVRTVLAILIPLIASGTIIAAISVLADIPFNYANVIVLPLVLGLGVDSGIHLALRRSVSGDTGVLFASSTPRAVVFSGLTTIVAFASLALSSHRGTASMGELLAISITVTLAGTLAMTPILIDFIERLRRPALAPSPGE